MNKLRCSIFAVALTALGSFATFSCSGNDPEIVDPKEQTQKKIGVYKVEVTTTGDLEGFVPKLIFAATYAPIEVNQPIYDETGKEVMSIAGTTACNYEEDPAAFSKQIVRYSTNRASGLTVSLMSGNINAFELGTTHKIKITFKGYLDGKLIKTETKEVDNTFSGQPNESYYAAEFKIGESSFS